MTLRRDVGPHSANQNGAALERILLNKFAPTIPEGTNQPRTDHACLATYERLAPLMRFRIEQEQRQPFPMAFRSISFNLFEGGPAAPYLSYSFGPVEFERGALIGEWVQKALDMRMPEAEAEIEVVRARNICNG